MAQERRSALEVEPLGADVLALARTGGDHDSIADAFGVLLDHDRIGAGRQDAAREDPRGLADTNRSLERMPGCHFADELEIDRYLRNVRRAHGVAVHSRYVRGRLGPQRRDIGSQHAAAGFRERGGFSGKRLGLGEHAR